MYQIIETNSYNFSYCSKSFRPPVRLPVLMIHINLLRHWTLHPTHQLKQSVHHILPREFNIRYLNCYLRGLWSRRRTYLDLHLEAYSALPGMRRLLLYKTGVSTTGPAYPLGITESGWREKRGNGKRKLFDETIISFGFNANCNLSSTA